MEEQKTCYSPKRFSGFANGRIFISEIFDSGKAETVWDRLKLEIIPIENNSTRIKTALRVYIAEDKEILSKEKQRIPKDNVLISKYTDILLYGNSRCGRYLSFEAELLNGEALFSAYKITFPKLSFTQYLPMIYHGNDDLDRFLAVYQNQYLDAECEIMDFYRNLNAKESNMLVWLAGLTGGEMFLRLPEKIVRKLLGALAQLYKTKGTKNCLKLLVYTLTGETPVIVDCADELTENERRLFGAQNGHFYLMLKSRPDIVPDLFNCLIKQFIPINAYYTTVFLDENRNIGRFCFLGVNSIITDKKQPVVGASRLGEDLRL